MISILPPQCAKYLPENWRPLVLEENSPIHDFYPKNITVDPNGKRYKSNYTVLVPFVDEKILHQVLQDRFSTLTPEERKQNEVENDLLFIYSQAQDYIRLKPFLEANGGKNITYENPLDIMSEIIGIPGCIWRDVNDDKTKLIDKSIKAPMPNYKNISNNQVLCVKYL